MEKPGPKERFKLVSAVHLLLVKDDQILLLRRYNTGYRDGEYSVPAGHLDGGEPATIAMVREVAEEIGLKMPPEGLNMVHTMHRNSTAERLDFFFVAKGWDGEPENREPGKCDELRWVPMDSLPENLIPYVRKAIDCYRKGIPYSEFGWTVPDEK